MTADYFIYCWHSLSLSQRRKVGKIFSVQSKHHLMTNKTNLKQNLYELCTGDKNTTHDRNSHIITVRSLTARLDLRKFLEVLCKPPMYVAFKIVFLVHVIMTIEND